MVHVYIFLLLTSTFGAAFLKITSMLRSIRRSREPQPIYRSISQAVLRVEYAQYNTAQYPKYASVLSRNTISVNTPDDSILCVYLCQDSHLSHLENKVTAGARRYFPHTLQLVSRFCHHLMSDDSIPRRTYTQYDTRTRTRDGKMTMLSYQFYLLASIRAYATEQHDSFSQRLFLAAEQFWCKRS